VESFLKEKGAKFEEVKLKSDKDRKGLVSAIKRVSLIAGFSTRVAARVALAADEILMNAIFDAPENGSSTSSEAGEGAAFPKSGRGAVTFQIGYDGSQLGILVSDRYGSLDKQKLLSHISLPFPLQGFTVSQERAGAGLGLATTRRTGCSMFFICNAGIKTEVLLFFRQTKDFRRFQKQFRFLSTLFFRSRL
jgi:hypothetical protein